MPQIAGVTQGAMVLDDTPFRDLTLHTLLKTTAPKVEGSMNLDNLFQENTLDFFVFFSSVVSVLGRPGQANYSAANMFMCSLAEQRRQKGLAASIIHIGAIFGVGYTSQLDRKLFTKVSMRSSALVPISQRDFYQLFAEAVKAGRPGSSSSTIELFSGSKRINPHDDDQPVWATEPLMSHFIQNSEGLTPLARDNQSAVPLRTQLAQATNQIQVHSIIQHALFPKICILFQLDPTKVAIATLAKMRLDEMGIDSLLAVEIRGWFMKTLEVNIPILKILSGVPISDLVAFATENIPERLVPNLQNGEGIESLVEVHDLSTSQETTERPETSKDPTVISSNSSISSVESGVKSVDESPKPLPSAIQKSFRLSFSQEMFWFVWYFLEDKSSLNHTAWARITGKIRIADFQNAIRSLSQQHEALRTCIIEQDGQPIQGIMNSSVLHLELGQIKEEKEVHAVVASYKDHHVFDIARGQTVRISLLSRSPEEHYFVAALHPLIADGISFQTLLRGIQHLYTHPNDNKTLITRQFSDYSEKQHSDYAAGKLQGDLNFWRSEFATLPPPLPILTLSKATSRPVLKSYENERAVFSISPKTREQIQIICRRYRATPFHFYLTAFRILLLRYSRMGTADDVVIGIGDANRTEDEMVDIIGPFVNFLPLRFRTKRVSQFAHLLQNTRDKTYSALAHSKIPFQVLLHE
ncbi:Hybrid PKS-NRPS synthetase [Lachnellula subtilissima]|uniref:Hybrid PKS-NRPS synthetase n=1 Tax=Lachnellula subtilissima TaxID=602034 RepID=A0A8H8RLQ2_9HELO|nr:Hybrid PKS-NRPS synthetase [Lachnellula subtilissima]